MHKTTSFARSDRDGRDGFFICIRKLLALSRNCRIILDIPVLKFIFVWVLYTNNTIKVGHVAKHAPAVFSDIFYCMRDGGIRPVVVNSGPGPVVKRFLGLVFDIGCLKRQRGVFPLFQYTIISDRRSYAAVLFI